MKIRNKPNKSWFGWPLGLVLLIMGGISGLLSSHYQKDKEWFVSKTLEFRRVLWEKEAVTRDALQLLPELANRHSGLWQHSHVKALEGISMFAYRNDSLQFWTSARVPMPVTSFDDEFERDILKLRNGWYRVVSQQDGPWQLVGLILLKRDYFINNEFLKDGFDQDFGLEEGVELSLDPESSDFHVTDKEGRFLFALGFDLSRPDELRFPALAGISYLLSLLALLYTVLALRRLRFFRKRPAAHLFLFISVIALVRWANIRFRYPPVLYDLPLFAPEHFASSAWLPSLGDFLLHVLLLTAVLSLAFINFSRFQIKLVSRHSARLWVLLFGAIAATFSYLVHLLIRILVFDSNISFDLSNILDLSVYSFVGFSLITLLLVNYFIIVHFCSKILSRIKRPGAPVLLGLTLIPFLLVTLLGIWLGEVNLPAMGFSYLIYLAVMSIHFRDKVVFDFYAFIPTLVLFSGFATFLLWQLNSAKEVEQRKVLALKIAEEQDHVAEFLFLEAADKIRKDHIVRFHLFSNRSAYPFEFFERIAQQYFSGYWSRYALVIMPFSQDELQRYRDFPEYSDPDLYAYESAIEYFGKPTASPELFFIDNDFANVSYLGRIPVEQVKNGDTLVKYIYLEFISKMVTQVTGFPELLLDKSVARPVHLGNYSYAIYKNGNLHVSAGEYTYLLGSEPFENPQLDLEWRIINRHTHLIYAPDSNRLVVVSLPQPRFLDVLNPFAYLLLYFSIILFLVFSYRYYFENPGQLLRFTLKGRIQLTIFLVLLVSLILVGLGIHDYINTQFDRKNRATIEEKVSAILSELKREIGEEVPWENREELNYLLTRYSNIFFTDINLYEANGFLMASSREAIFNEGLVSRLMDPAAFSALSANNRPRFLHKEQIGNFEYLSAYAAFRDPYGEVTAYINLPYFLRQNDLREELSSSLLALINIYSLLIVASMVVSLLIANRLTGPLSILQDNLSQLRLGRKNARISYRGNDEISGLVAEYNRMVHELEQSAELLAKSERESAWKEMARQVAHEVKNPLTPMKLSVQYLLRAWEDGKPDFDQRLTRFRDAMLEQIETLSNIASEFSYFAKLPETRLVRLNLINLADNCVAFFQNNEQGIRISVNSGIKEAWILADRDQLLRVFNNLMRNAIQAIPEDRDGEIRIEIRAAGENVRVDVIDNGTGIPIEIQEKIFLPNFTTKGSGMGLGLAMTRTIIENCGGSIRFLTREGAGSTFSVLLPLAKGKAKRMDN
jgi:two-component system, NtrC family, nitrogen regulation sensor histidine kinase NtrY